MVKRKEMPDWGEFVLCTVERITPYAAWCRMDEYPGIEGMIHVSEVSGKWVHDIREFVKPNKQYVAKVVKIDYQKNAVNLSLKRVTKFDEREKTNAFRRNQRAEKMLEMAGREMGKSVEQAHEEVGYLIQEKFGRKGDVDQGRSRAEKLFEERFGRNQENPRRDREGNRSVNQVHLSPEIQA
ncbi:MAG: S1 RNA-binding domain-containing protein [Candidatus Aenigmarchaeota archaeon]|nr:S1 RNA-binding domain-containing protein [Candidatus Aenigmarchaeota archaeon]